MDVKEDDIRTTPSGSTYEIIDEFKEQREKLLGDEGPLPELTQIALAELYRCSVHQLDEHYDMDQLRIGVKILTVQSDLQAEQEWQRELDAKHRANRGR